jgi:hypothetical protein
MVTQKFVELDKNFTIDDIINNLYTISKINTGDKLTHDDKNITVDNSYVPCISRFYYKISRYTNLEFIDKILNETYKYLYKFKNNNDPHFEILKLQLLLKLKLSVNGLLKLRQTYSNDALFIENLDITIKKLYKHI